MLGAKGFLGRHVARRFDAEGWRVEGLGRGQWVEHAEWGLVAWHDSTVTTRSLEELAREGLPDAVFCAAGSGTVRESFSNAEKAYDDTVGSAKIALDFLVSNAPEAVFVYPSSCAVYGSRDDEPIREDSSGSPASPYGTYKLAVERECHRANGEWGLRCGVIRFFSLYGPGLRKQLIWDLAARAQGERTITLSGTGDETRDLLHIDDACRLVSLVTSKLVDGDAKEIFIVNGGTGRALTVREIARQVVKQLPGDTSMAFSGTIREGDPPHFRADLTRARSLGFEPHWSPEDGITEYCAWIKDELWGGPE